MGSLTDDTCELSLNVLLGYAVMLKAVPQSVQVGVMDNEKSDVMRKREARRQRILQNSQKRLHKLKNVE